MKEYRALEKFNCLVWVSQIPGVKPWFIQRLAETFFQRGVK